MSTSCFDREDETFILLVNHEEQYSIWPQWKAVPAGWTAVAGVQGDKKTVLDHVEKVWTDMRPKSLRDWMAQQESGRTGEPVATGRTTG
ncbi:MbtH family NRPS accessory protein [Rhizobacter sp. Root1221]|uniref:MbtH family protein n=1 Tax=Rhizobacter sp. Root1221 TaxID=1736433 RepID=UPI0006FD5124|nr:MbtH family NRPS accessory protein [Rhizobacter sp. Root1221]KQV97188.1 antibiotic synthesis protein MbtH [Rhizobacter sp. Root1221]